MQILCYSVINKLLKMYSGEIIPHVTLSGCSPRGKLANPSHSFEHESGAEDDVRGVITGAKALQTGLLEASSCVIGVRTDSSILLCYTAFYNC